MSRQLRVGINGCGRIGRALLRQYFSLPSPQFQVVVIHDLMPLDQLHYLLCFDSVHGRLLSELDVVSDKGLLSPHGLICYDTAPDLPQWDSYDLDLVIDVSGVFSRVNRVRDHLTAGASKVLLGSPLLDEEGQLCGQLPVYAGALRPGDILDLRSSSVQADKEVLTSYSCTTQALHVLLAPLLTPGSSCPEIKSLLVTELHGFTAGQSLVDQAHQDWRRGRSAPESIIPTPTQGILGVESLFPELSGKTAGYSIRVPVPNIAAVDVSLHLAESVALEDILSLYRAAQQEDLQGILTVDQAPGVSIDYVGRTESAVLAADLCQVVGHQLRLYAWYDNEYGYANRIINALQDHRK